MRDASPRSLAAIDADIAATMAKLRALHDERRASGRSRNADIVAEFRAGKPVKAIALDRGTSYAAIAGVLLRAGHTVKARKRVSQQLEHQAIVERHAAATRAAHQVEHRSVEWP